MVDKVRAVRGLCAPSVMVARLRSGCERERGRAEARCGEGSNRCAVRRQAGTERARTSGGGGARGFPSVRVARGCTHPYKMRGAKMGALPHLSVRRKIVDKLRGMWYNGGGRQLCPTVERRERKGEAKANETRAKGGGLLQV